MYGWALGKPVWRKGDQSQAQTWDEIELFCGLGVAAAAPVQGEALTADANLFYSRSTKI